MIWSSGTGLELQILENYLLVSSSWRHWLRWDQQWRLFIASNTKGKKNISLSKIYILLLRKYICGYLFKGSNSKSRESSMLRSTHHILRDNCWDVCTALFLQPFVQIHKGDLSQPALFGYCSLELGRHLTQMKSTRFSPSGKLNGRMWRCRVGSRIYVNSWVKKKMWKPFPIESLRSVPGSDLTGNMSNFPLNCKVYIPKNYSSFIFLS